MSLDKKTVANRYAKAIFELAEENGQLDQTYQELSALRQVFEENDSLAALLSGVDLSLAEKKSLIDALKKDASPFVSNLIWSQLLMSLNGATMHLTNASTPK